MDFVEQPAHGYARAQFRKAPVILLQQQPELLGRQLGQAVVVEAQVDDALRRLGGAPPGLQLPQKRGLAGPAHADDRVRLAGHRGKRGVPARRRERGLGRDGGVQLFVQDRVQGHGAELWPAMCPSVKYR